MRRYSLFLVFPVLIGLILSLPSCGGGTPKANVVATVSLPVSTISLNKGDVYTLSPRALTFLRWMLERGEYLVPPGSRP